MDIGLQANLHFLRRLQKWIYPICPKQHPLPIRMSDRSLQYVQSYFSKPNGRLPCLCHPLTVGGPIDIRQLSFQLQQRKQILGRLSNDYATLLALTRNICKRMAIDIKHQDFPQLDLPQIQFADDQQEEIFPGSDTPQRPYVRLRKPARQKDTVSENRKRHFVRKYAEAARNGMTLARFCLLHQLAERDLNRWMSLS